MSGLSPRWVRIFAITGRSRMAAMIFSSPPPQFGQVCMSMPNARLSSRAQLMRPDRQLQGGEIGAAYVS